MSEEAKAGQATTDRWEDILARQAEPEAPAAVVTESAEAPTAEGKPAGDTEAKDQEAAETPAGEEPKGEAAEEPKAEEPPQKVSRAVADVARRQRQLDQRERQLRAATDQLQAQAQAVQQFVQNLRADPVQAMLQAGFTAEDAQAYISRVLDEGKVDPSVRRVQEELQELKRLQAAEKAELARIQTEKAVRDFQEQISRTVREGGERWELVRAGGHEADVYRAMDEYVKQNDIRDPADLPSIEEVADLVEKALEAKAEAYEGTAKRKRVRTTATDQKVPTQKVSDRRGEGPRTLADVSAARTAGGERDLTDEERWERLLQRSRLTG